MSVHSMCSPSCFILSVFVCIVSFVLVYGMYFSVCLHVQYTLTTLLQSFVLEVGHVADESGPPSPAIPFASGLTEAGASSGYGLIREVYAVLHLMTQVC